MGSKLTRIQRHNRIFVFILCGFLLVEAVRMALAPNPTMLLMVALPVLLAVMCISVVGMHRMRSALLVSTAVSTGLEFWLLWDRLGGWNHGKFWQALLVFVPFNAGVGICAMVFSLLVALKFRQRLWPRRETVDYAGKSGE